MKPRVVTAKEIVDYFTRSPNGIEIETAAGKARFIVKPNDLRNGLYYFPKSTMKRRHHTKFYFERFINQYNKLLSFTSSHYSNISANGSYALGAIKYFINNCSAQQGDAPEPATPAR